MEILLYMNVTSFYQEELYLNPNSAIFLKFLLGYFTPVSNTTPLPSKRELFRSCLRTPWFMPQTIKHALLLMPLDPALFLQIFLHCDYIVNLCVFFLTLSPLGSVPVCLSCLLFSRSMGRWVPSLASLTDSTYVPEDGVGGLHAGMNVVRHVAV